MVFTPPHREIRDRYPGLYVGQVEDNDLGLGRVQVSVPSVFDHNEPDAFVWARPCFPYGHFFVPEVGDKVWITFENGLPEHPVWLGIWYPEGTLPDDANGSPPVKRLLRSAKNQIVLLDDTDDSEAIIIRDKAGNRIELNSTSGSETVIVSDVTGNRIELRSDGVLIQCVQNLTIDASGKNIVIKASSVDIQQS
jgi:uncharacterized protein involved in type VI secretion and phage assembly